MGNANQNLKTYQFVLGLVIFLLGILMLITLRGTIRYFGIVIIFGTIIYFAIVLYLNFRQSDHYKFKSLTREQILRRQHKS